MILERSLILLGFILCVGVGWMLWQFWQQQRLGHLQQSSTLPTFLAQQVMPGQPAVLYFTSEGCIQCKFQQAPVLERFAADTGVRIHTVDAVAQADVADFYGVMTVPTTVVLDRQRRPVAINLGLAPLQKLRQQVEAA